MQGKKFKSEFCSGGESADGYLCLIAQTLGYLCFQPSISRLALRSSVGLGQHGEDTPGRCLLVLNFSLYLEFHSHFLQYCSPTCSAQFFQFSQQCP